MIRLLRQLYSAARCIRRFVAPRRTDAFSEASVVRAILGDQRLVAVDVGAARGLLPHWQSLPHVATVYQIEPRQDACPELEAMNRAAGYAQNCRIVNVGLSGAGGDRTLYVSNAPTGSSLFEIDLDASPDCGRYVDARYLYPLVPTPIQTLSLSAVLDMHGEPHMDLVKLDIQGAELEVLQGLTAGHFDGLLGIEIELGLHDLYPKQAGFQAAHEYFESRGFELFDVRVARVHLPRDGDHEYFQKRVFSTFGNSPTVSARVWEFDALYLPRRSILLDRNDAGALRRMLVVYCTYNFFAEAYDLVDEGHARGLIEEVAARDLKQAIVDLHHVKHARPWLAENRLMNWLRRRAYLLAPRSAPRWCQYMYQDYPNG